MVRTAALFAALAAASVAYAQTSCGLNNKCPSDTPCCSQYGQCGVGAYCLGGCDPRASFNLDSCTPEPVCVSKTYTFENMDGITSNTEYLGDSSKTDWVMSGEAVIYNDNVLLTMPVDSVGTLLASSTYMWYGNMKATFKTSRGQGVVTAFILLSDVKDEIDYEFVGADLETAQSNYYFQGIPNYDNELNISLSDTFNNYHTYEVDWTPDTITWLVDGQVGRTKKRSDTWNATSNQWDFPQTPARVQLSLWPAGLASNGQGTVDWAGGLVDWNSADIQNNGYYYASFESVTISCYNGSSGVGTNTGKSYTYSSVAGTNDTVVDGTKDTILSSFQATGNDVTLGAVSSGSTAKASSTAQSVPGLSGGGPGTDSHGSSGSSDSGDSGSSSGSSGSSSSSSTSSGASSTDSSSGSTSTSSSSSGGFSQGQGSSGSGSSKSGADKLGGQERVMKGSVFAGIIAVVAMMAL